MPSMAALSVPIVIRCQPAWLGLIVFLVPHGRLRSWLAQRGRWCWRMQRDGTWTPLEVHR